MDHRTIKRFIDVLVTAIFLVFFWPIFILIGLLVKLESPGPVLYRHQRIGKAGVPFSLVKFRTMAANSDDGDYLRYLKALIESERGGNGNGNGKPYRKMETDGRVTRVGNFLRKYYLDELPQMWNILKGEMSLVGPRPHVQFEVNYYTAEQRRRLSVSPGATGLWQVAGKGDSTFNELIALDLDYVDHWSLRLDFSILLRTFRLMLRGGEGSWTRTAKSVPRKKQGLPFHAAAGPVKNSENKPLERQGTR